MLRVTAAASAGTSAATHRRSTTRAPTTWPGNLVGLSIINRLWPIAGTGDE